MVQVWFLVRERDKKVGQGLQSSHWKWYFEEVFVKVNGERNYLLLAVDHYGELLET